MRQWVSMKDKRDHVHGNLALWCYYVWYASEQKVLNILFVAGLKQTIKLLNNNSYNLRCNRNSSSDKRQITLPLDCYQQTVAKHFSERYRCGLNTNRILSKKLAVDLCLLEYLSK